jgi:hypothetical protein
MGDLKRGLGAILMLAEVGKGSRGTGGDCGERRGAAVRLAKRRAWSARI